MYQINFVAQVLKYFFRCKYPSFNFHFSVLLRWLNLLSFNLPREFFFFCPHLAALGNLKCQSKRGSRNFPPERIGGDRKLIFFAWFVRGLLFVPLLCQTNAKFYVFSKLFWEAYHSFKINFYNVINQFRFIKNELKRMCHCFLVMNFLGEQSTHQSIPWR